MVHVPRRHGPDGLVAAERVPAEDGGGDVDEDTAMLVSLLGQDDAELAPPGEVAPVARALGEGWLAGRPGERDDQCLELATELS